MAGLSPRRDVDGFTERLLLPWIDGMPWHSAATSTLIATP
jgi:hypothetical protein